VKTEADVFPELYSLWLTVEEFPCQHLVFRHARLLLHRPDAEARAGAYDFAALIRGYDAADPWMAYPRRFITDDLFSRDETAAIAAYLARHPLPGMTFYKARQPFPIPNHWAPCNAAGYGAWEGEYLFDAAEGFDCPVRFWGYYWLGETPVVAGLAQVTCASDGSLAIEGLGSPSTVLGPQADLLCQAWLKAKSLGKTERVTIRYNLALDHPLPGAIARSLAQARVF
jgi:hypothetical protein